MWTFSMLDAQMPHQAFSKVVLSVVVRRLQQFTRNLL